MTAARSRRIWVIGTVVAPALAVATVGVGGASAATPSRVAVAGSTPAWTAQTAPLAGVASATPVTVRVYLAPKGGLVALKAAVAAVSNPGSASYRDYVTPSQYRAKYEPTSAAVASVSAWLRSSGLKVTGVENSHRFITATGTAAAAQAAFATTLRTYRHLGHTVIAPAGTVSVPSAVAADVQAVSGLDTTPQTAVTGPKPTAGTAASGSVAFPPPAAFVNARPCSLYYGQLVAKYQADYQTPLPKFNGQYRDYAVCGYVPSQLRGAYEGTTSLTGKGVTVAVVDAYAASTILKDANTYATRHGDAPFAAGQFSQSLPSSFKLHSDLCQTPADWAGEETLDVEAVHGMAPGANVRYYGATSCLDPDLAVTLDRVVDENKASIVTNSYGDPESLASVDTIVAYEQAFLQGALQGISFLFSSGDSGDEVANSGLLQADYPASDPYVTAVGGTTTAIDAANRLAFQTGWGTQKYTLSANGKSWVPIAPDPFLYGSGGGYSALFNLPAYQRGVVPAASGRGRAVPDVALDADPTTGMLVGETQQFPHSVHYGEYRIGGTSLASPLMAGVQALADQNAGGRLGFLNPALYARHAAGVFTDVTSVHHTDANVRPDYVNSVDPTGGIVYSVRTFDHDSSLRTAPGWDDVTGLGSPNARYLTSF